RDFHSHDRAPTATHTLSLHDALPISDDADVGVLKVDIQGGTPRVAGLVRDPRSLERGDPVAIIGYPLGFDLPMEGEGLGAETLSDRKSTRLNSSHRTISYAVFCLKKK